MATNDWMTVREAAKWMQRSKGTIYKWIRLSREGKTEAPLSIKRVVRMYDGKEGNGWLIESRSLQLMSRQSPRCRHLRKQSKANSLTRGGDTLEKTLQDRQRWVEGWVAEGKSLRRVLNVFDASLHPEIEGYYQQAVTDADG